MLTATYAECQQKSKGSHTQTLIFFSVASLFAAKSFMHFFFFWGKNIFHLQDCTERIMPLPLLGGQTGSYIAVHT